MEYKITDICYRRKINFEKILFMNRKIQYYIVAKSAQIHLVKISAGMARLTFLNVF